MKDSLTILLQQILKDMGITDVSLEVTMSGDATHGEYTTNIAMRLSKQLKKPPMDIALQVKEAISRQLSGVRHEVPDQKSSKKHQIHTSNSGVLSILSAIDHIEVVPPGFINVFMTESALSSRVLLVLKDAERYGGAPDEPGKQKNHLMVEFTDPNPFKEFHIGHLYSNAVGESLARLYEAIGWTVTRADYFGDVGMHVAKSIWGLQKNMKEENLTLINLAKKPLAARVQYLGQAYTRGATIYEEKSPEAETAKEEMKNINYMVYLAAQEYMQKTLNWVPQVDYHQYVKINNMLYKEVQALYEKGRTWSMEYFETIFVRLGTHFDAYYPESIVGEYGAKLVREHIGKVFEESDGAVVFRGESSEEGLHTRVFLNSLGLPTYEAKELGLNWKKSQDYELDRSFIVTGNEINEYFKVLFAAMAKVIPEVEAKTKHIGHGMVRNADGSKISSRLGNVLTGEGMLNEVKNSMYEILKQSKSKYTKSENDDIAEKASIAAIKYSLLRVSLPSNVAFNISTSVSFEGDSGPYLLYTYARCKSVLRRVAETPKKFKHQASNTTPEEHQLARLILFFPEIVTTAAEVLAPNVLCTYLFQLAQVFNLFYQKHPILGAQDATGWRLALTAATAQVLHNGLFLLGISTIERM